VKYKILGIIPARGGSKGILKKNIIPVAGKPLLVWTVEAAKKSRVIDRIIVSSDSDEILSVAKDHGVIGLKRPASLATNDAPPEKTVLHAIKECRSQKYIPDFIVYLQPTSPLRTAEHIDRAFELLRDKNANALISVSQADSKFLKAFFLTKDGYLKSISKKAFSFMNRQKLPAVYLPNGAIYILRTEDFLRHKKFWIKNTLPFIMSPEESIDLDATEDIPLVEDYLLRKGR